MSIVSITQVNVLDNPTHFANPYQFEITFECIAPLTAGKQQQNKTNPCCLLPSLTSPSRVSLIVSRDHQPKQTIPKN
jgi:hypothetical protein